MQLTTGKLRWSCLYRRSNTDENAITTKASRSRTPRKSVPYAKVLEESSGKRIEPKLQDTQTGFRSDPRTTEKNFTLQENFDKSWQYAKVHTHILTTSRKHTIGFLVISFEVLREYGVVSLLLLPIKSLCLCSDVCFRVGELNHNLS